MKELVSVVRAASACCRCVLRVAGACCWCVLLVRVAGHVAGACGVLLVLVCVAVCFWWNVL